MGTALAADGGATAELPPLKPLPFAEAIAWAKARKVVLPDRYYGELQGLARAMAFSIAGLAKLDQLQAVQDSLVANMETGESFGQWKKRVASGEIPLDLPDHRIECLPGDNRVSGAVIRAGHRRWYEGRIVEVVTNNGRKFTATPNHPMLTLRGWVAAGELCATDDLIGYRFEENHCPPGDQHEHESPSAISDVFVSLSQSAVVERVGGRGLDFHGDGTEADVEIVRAARDLHFGRFFALREPLDKLSLAKADFSALRFCPDCHHLVVVSQRCGFCDRPYFDASGAQSVMDSVIAGAIMHSQCVGALAACVAHDKLINWDIVSESIRRPSVGEMQAPCSTKRPTNAGFFHDATNPPQRHADGCGNLLDAPPGEIEVDRVVALRFIGYSGHVYNLSTAHGYYLLDGLYTGNTIFRTNIQGNYNRGRCEQQRENVGTHPWYLYDAVNDSRTRPSHAALDGMVARHDDPIWRTHTPPLGFQCRCRRIALTEKQAERFRAADAKRMQDPELAAARAYAKPDPGWDYSVCEEPTEGPRRAIEKRASNASETPRTLWMVAFLQKLLGNLISDPFQG